MSFMLIGIIIAMALLVFLHQDFVSRTLVTIWVAAIVGVVAAIMLVTNERPQSIPSPFEQE